MWQLCKSDYTLSPGFVVAVLYSHCYLFSDISCTNWEKSLYAMCGHLSLFGWSSSCWSDFLKGLEPIFLSLLRGLCACCMPSTFSQITFSSTLSFHFLLSMALGSATEETLQSSIGFPQQALWPCSAKLVADKPGKGALGYSQNGVQPPQPGIPTPRNTSTTTSSLVVPYYASVVYSSVIPPVFKTEFDLGLILPVPYSLGLCLP